MERKKNNLFLRTIFLFFIVLGWVKAQENTPETKIYQEKIELLHANITEKKEDVNPDALFLKGEIKFKHNDSILTCQEATYYEKKNLFLGKGDIKIESKNRTLTAQSIRYEGSTGIYEAFGEVTAYENQTTLKANRLIYDSKTKLSKAIEKASIFLEGGVRINSDFLEYDANTKQAYYPHQGTIYKEDDKLTSQKGVYFSNDKRAEFTLYVTLENNSHKIYSQKAIYYTEEKKMDFLGPTTIEKKENPSDFMYLEKGTHYSEKKHSEAFGNSSIHHDGKILKGDYLFYDHTSGFGKAKGNVWLENPKEKTYLSGGYGEIYKNPDYAIIKEKPILIKELKGDKLYLHAEIIKADRQKDGSHIIEAYHHVKVFKSDLQGNCDRILFNESKKEIELIKDPIIWIENKQITGEKMFIYLDQDNKNLDALEIIERVFIIYKANFFKEDEFNQISAKHLKGTFEKNSLKKALLKGNAQSILFIEDEKNLEDKIIGINNSTCGIIDISFQEKEKKIDQIICREKSRSQLSPKSKLSNEEKKLFGFIWREKEKPLNKEDIFIADLLKYREEEEKKEEIKKELKSHFNEHPTLKENIN